MLATSASRRQLARTSTFNNSHVASKIASRVLAVAGRRATNSSQGHLPHLAQNKKERGVESTLSDVCYG